MNCNCGICGNCKNPWPGNGGLAGSLIPMADDLRQMYTEFGVRPYRVYSVVYKWSGGEIGRGERQLFSQVELLPTPRLAEWNGINTSPRSGGMAERGNARLTQVSARYSESQIRGMFFSDPMPKGCEGFVEIWNAKDGEGESVPRRRFAVFGVPFYDAEKFQWRVDLLRQDQDINAHSASVPVGRPR